MKKLLVFLLVPFFSGCFLGTFRSAEPIGAGNVEKKLYFNVPFYYSRSYKEGARTSGTYYTGVGLGAMLNFGASDFMDFGAKLDLAEGLGPQWKFRFINYYPLSVAPSKPNSRVNSSFPKKGKSSSSAGATCLLNQLSLLLIQSSASNHGSGGSLL
jgi:hypothetical protein